MDSMEIFNRRTSANIDLYLEWLADKLKASGELPKDLAIYHRLAKDNKVVLTVAPEELDDEKASVVTEELQSKVREAYQENLEPFIALNEK